MCDSEAIAAELRRELESLLSDELVREIVAEERTSRLAALLNGLVL